MTLAPPEVPDLLPPPPWRLHPRFVRGQVRRACLFFAIAIAALVFVQFEVRALFGVWRDCAVHAAADVTVPARWNGFQDRFARYWRKTEGRVTWTAPDGRPTQRPLELWTAFQFSTSAPLTVSYVATEPERWVASWAVEQAANRCWASAAVLAFAFMFLGFGLWRGFAATRLLRLARVVAPDGVVRLGRQQGHVPTYIKGRVVARRYRVVVRDDDGSARIVHATFPAGQGAPLTLPGARTVVIVPRDGSPRALVLRHDLWPLQLTADQAERTAAILYAIDPDAGWRVAAAKDGPRVTCRVRHGRE